MQDVFNREQRISDKRYRNWFGPIVAKYPEVQRIVIATKVQCKPRDIWDTGVRTTAVVQPSQAVLIEGNAGVYGKLSK